MTTANKWYWVIGTLWFMCIMTLLYQIADNDLAEFDPQQSLVNNINTLHFERDFTEQLKLSINSLSNKVIHFTQPNCACNRVAASHIKSVQELAVQQTMINETLDISSKQFQRFIPSTPAVAVFNEQEVLVYLGPYSAGYACSKGNGIVESYILKQKNTEFGPAVISQTRGCYCAVTPKH